MSVVQLTVLNEPDAVIDVVRVVFDVAHKPIAMPLQPASQARHRLHQSGRTSNVRTMKPIKYRKAAASRAPADPS